MLEDVKIRVRNITAAVSTLTFQAMLMWCGIAFLVGFVLAALT